MLPARGGTVAKQKQAPLQNAAPVLLPLVGKAEGHPCHNCSRCCGYVALEIDAPTTPKEYDHILWYLYHPGVSIFVDWESGWYIRFESRCENLNAQGMCGIYETRPAICKDFDWRECERRFTPEDGPPDKWNFQNAAQFVQWLKRRRPKSYERFARFQRKRRAQGEEAVLTKSVVQLQPVPPPAPAQTKRGGKNRRAAKQT